MTLLRLSNPLLGNFRALSEDIPISVPVIQNIRFISTQTTFSENQVENKWFEW
jgi:hypothetical protein